MFNVGSEDKEKLRENMEEIKNLIQGKKDQKNEPQPAATPSQNEESSLGTGIEEGYFDNSQPLGSEAGSTTNQLEQTEPEFKEQDTTQQTSVDQASESDFKSDFDSQSSAEPSQEFSPNSQQNSLQDTQDENVGFDSSETTVNNNQGQVVNSTSNQTSQQPQTRSQRDNPSQNLFLEVERFEKVKEMINEMQQITEDIETTSNELEDQINDERESENVAQQLLNNFDDRKREVEDVILDSEEN